MISEHEGDGVFGPEAELTLFLRMYSEMCLSVA